MNPITRTSLVLALFMTPLAAAQDSSQPDPEIERRSFKVADGFEVTLFAADPLVAKPIEMNFDSAGRLWIATSTVYPQVKPGETPDDKIVVLEDADGDGKADKSHVFAGGLLIPTGVEPGDGGAYVANSTELVHFADADGDLKADTNPDARRVVLSGFGTEDTHHIIHTFRWGHDGRLFFNQSIYIHSHVETPWGTRRLNGSGVWRFDPRAAKLDVYARGMINPWGLCWETWGQSFATDGAGFGGIHYAFPGSAFESATEVKRTLSGLNPGSPKYCANEFISGRHVPDDWQNSIITNDFRANRVVRYQISDQDGVYVSKLMPDVITSTDRAFRPVDVKMGPDGAIYIADWYNPIINHGEVDFRDPRRDKAHGRIWRLTAKGRPLVQRPKLVGASVPELLEHLKAPEHWTRHHAKLQLRAKGAKEVTPHLAAWVKKLDAKDPNVEHHRLEALWAYQSVDEFEPQLLKSLLNSKDHRAREAATRVVPDWADRLPDALDLLRERCADAHPRVRLEAVCALARIPSPRSIEVAMVARDKSPNDPLMGFAIQMAANELKPVWMPAFQEGKLTFGGNRDHLNFALQAVESAAALKTVVEQLEFDTVPLAQREGVLDLVGSVGGPKEASLLIELALREEKSYDAAGKARLLERVERMARQRGVKPDRWGREFPNFFDEKQPPPVRAAALRTAGAMKREDLRDRVASIATAKETPGPVREAAVTALAEFGGTGSADVLRKLVAQGQSYRTRAAAVAALAAIDMKDAATRAAALLASGPADADPAPLLDGFLQREGGGEALGAALAGQKIPADVAKLGLRYVNTTGRDDPALTGRLREAAGLNATAQPPTAEEIARVVEEVNQKGDPARGELVFRRNDTGCLQCHATGGAGGLVGPDLRAIGASSPLDYVVESILVPGKVIKEGYQTVVVATKGGEVYSGIKVKQDERQIIVRDAQREHVIPVASVRREKEGGSLMPMGLADALTRQEFIDLVRFLSELGKPGPYGPDVRPVVRRWRVLDPASAQSVAENPSLLASPGAAAGLKWTAAYSLVGGTLPPDALPGNSVAFVRFEINVTAAGKIGLRMDDADGLKMWVGTEPMEVKQDVELDLPQGVHAVTFQVDKPQRQGKGLRVELFEPKSQAGAAQPVGGV